MELPDVHFGSVDAPKANWREYDEPDPDDEQLDETPSDVVMMLGFDPAEPDDETEDAGEFKESEHKRDKTGKFTAGSGGGGGAASKPAVAKSSGSGAAEKKAPKPGTKQHAIYGMVKSFVAQNGKEPTPTEFFKGVKDLGYDMKDAQSIKYLKGVLKEMKEEQATMKPAAKEAIAAAVPAEKQPEVKKAVEKAAEKPAPAAEGKTLSEQIASSGGFSSPAAMVANMAEQAHFPKEGTFNNIDYYKSTTGAKISYKPDSDSWMVKDKSGKVVETGSGVVDLAVQVQKLKIAYEAEKEAKKAEAAAAAPPPSPSSPASTSTAHAKMYSGRQVTKEATSFSSKGVSNEKSLPKPLQDSVSAYKGNTYYKAINDAMRFNDSFDDVSPVVAKHVLNLQNAFKKIHPSEKDVNVGRKIGIDALKTMVKNAGLQDLDHLKPGDVLTEPGVCSTSYSANVWHDHVKLNIKVPKGTKAIDISETINSSEQELLLPPDSKFRVVGIKSQKENGYGQFKYELDVEHFT